ncbi:hypothetical protein MMC07_006518 [Pseudocyphellaria aurata]|nr:hypothetical protein [Pseudocyphellaria aurata]
MAASVALQITKPSTTSPASQSNCYDPLNIEQYFNFDSINTSPSRSPDPSRANLAASSYPSLGNSNNTLLPSQPSNQQTFAGPSYQYELHKQQAGLPVGALANTLAVNQADSFQFGRNQPPSYPTDGFWGMNTTDEYLDFGSSPTFPSSSLSGDTDMEFDSPRDVLLANGGFVDPTAIGGQEDVSTPTQVNHGRVWPGIHQQTAMAKAQAQAQAQQKQQSQKAASQQPRRSNGSSSRPPSDPIVEERISRLLNQMRHSSVASSNDDENTTFNANGSSSHSMRIRKEEEDMDEDERLLASEEGKKLSSKERRQLRNKVSARAFRSRRKGQLEGEIAVKSAEADELRVKNEELMAENTRLADLTRMLLSSPAFSTFLNDLSSSGVSSSSAPVLTTPSSTVKPEQPQHNSRKDVNPHQAAQQQGHIQQSGPQIEMALIPETQPTPPPYDSATNAWPNIMEYSLYNSQVYSVTELPQGPAVDEIDPGMLSGKFSNIVDSYLAIDSKDEAPAFERMPAAEKIEAGSDAVSSWDDVDLDESDPAFALYADCPPADLSALEHSDFLFGGIEPDKAFSRLELVVEDETSGELEISAMTMERFERLCSPEALNQEALNQEALNQEALNQEALNQEALNQEALNQEALNQEALNQEALNQEALSQEALNQEALNQEALNQALN